MFLVGSGPFHVFAFPSDATPPISSHTISDEQLSEYIQDYVSGQDVRETERLLKKILDIPQATVQKVESLIQKGHISYAEPLLGILPSQPVRVRDHTFHYGLSVPDSYRPDRVYPLIICLHGAGFSGDAYLDRWQSRLGNRYILACPTLIQGTWWTRVAEELVLETIRTVQARYRIDPNRIFLTGMSNGGIGTWLIGFHHPDRFAGLAPMASGIDSILFPFLKNLRHTPVYIIHGSHDQVMPIRLSRTIVNRLKELNYSYVFREHSRTHPMAGGHFFPREELPALVTWFDGQQRNPYPASLSLVRDATHLVPLGWIRIDGTEQIAAFSENLIDSRDQFIVNRIYASLEANILDRHRIVVRTKRVRRFTLFLNHHLVDFSRPLTVMVNGEEKYSGRVEPTVETLLREARKRRDSGQLYSVQLPIPVTNEGLDREDSIGE